jgi:hypothetical protein
MQAHPLTLHDLQTEILEAQPIGIGLRIQARKDSHA